MVDRPSRILNLPPTERSNLSATVEILSLTDVILGLVKNSLDAYSTNIQICLDFIKGYCMVSDNGIGILQQELAHDGGLGKQYRMSFYLTEQKLIQIDTSKIGNDWVHGHSGCFLASLARVSLLSISSTTIENDRSYTLTLNDEKRLIYQPEESQIPHGTRVTVHNLFGNIPVRRRHLLALYEKQIEREVKNLKLELVALVLATSSDLKLDITELHTNRKFRLAHTKNPNLDSIVNLLSQTATIPDFDRKAWSKANVQTNTLIINAAFSSQAVPSKALQFISVRNKPITKNSTCLYDQINSIFDRAKWGNAIEKRPMFYIRIDQKTSVDHVLQTALPLLQDLIQEFIKSNGLHATKQAKVLHHKLHTKPSLSTFESWPRLKSAKPVNIEQSTGLPFCSLPQYPHSKSDLTWTDPKTGQTLFLNHRTGTAQSHQPKPCLPIRSISEAVKTIERYNTTDKTEIVPSSYPNQSLELNISKNDLKTACVVGQVDNKYILVKVESTNPNFILLIDQHAADERIKLEDLLQQICTNPKVTILSNPIIFEVKLEEAYQLERCKNYLHTWGISLNVTPNHHDNATINVSALPESIVERCYTQPKLLIALLRREIWSAHRFGKFQPNTHDWLINSVHCPQGILDMLISRACRSAIMFNDVLSIQQAHDLVQKLGECHFPFQCAHGRPTMTILTTINHPEYLRPTSPNFGQAWKAWMD